jgi:hypothetical protein
MPAQEAQDLCSEHLGEERDNIKLTRMSSGPARRYLMVWMNGVHPHVAWRVPHVSSNQPGQIVDQAVDSGAYGAHDGHKGDPFLVYFLDLKILKINFHLHRGTGEFLYISGIYTH